MSEVLLGAFLGLAANVLVSRYYAKKAKDEGDRYLEEIKTMVSKLFKYIEIINVDTEHIKPIYDEKSQFKNFSYILKCETGEYKITGNDTDLIKSAAKAIN